MLPAQHAPASAYVPLGAFVSAPVVQPDVPPTDSPTGVRVRLDETTLVQDPNGPLLVYYNFTFIVECATNSLFSLLIGLPGARSSSSFKPTMKS